MLCAALWGLAVCGGLGAQPLAIYCEEAPPFQQTNPDGTLSGLAVEIVQQVQKRVRNSDPIQIVPWSRGYAAALGQPNTVLFCTSRTAAREALFQWVGPVHETVFAFYAKADSPLKLADLQEARKVRSIGVYTQDVRDQYLTAQGFTNLDRVYDSQTVLKKLFTGQIDLSVSTRSEIGSEAQAAGLRASDFREILPLFRVQTYLAFSRGTAPATVKAWQEALDALKKDGTFERIYRRYLPANPLPGPALPPP